MKRLLTIICLAAVSAGAAMIEYQGRILGGEQPFVGEGQFCFAVVDEADQPLWTSGALPKAGDTQPLDDSLKLTLTNGVYHVRLGDTSAEQPTLDEIKILTSPGCRLRIWFNDGTNGWHHAGQDVVLDDALRESRAKFISSDQAEAILRGLRELRMRLERENARAAEAAEAAKETGSATPLESKP